MNVSFLSDSGVTAPFNDRSELVRLSLDQTRSFSDQLKANPEVMAIVQPFLDNTEDGGVTLAGWIDQAVLEVKLQKATFSDCLTQADTYRPDQNGDLGIYVLSHDRNKLLAIEFSPGDGHLTVSMYDAS